MKKIFAFVLALTLAFAFTACGSGNSDAAASLKIGVPNDTTNEARALLLLEDNGIITLKEGAGITATKNDIAENPYNVFFAFCLDNSLQCVVTAYATAYTYYVLHTALRNNPQGNAPRFP